MFCLVRIRQFKWSIYRAQWGRVLPYLAYRGVCHWTGLVFKVLSLKRGVFLDWKPLRVWTVKTCNERSTIAIPIIFFLNIHFHDFCVKNYLILYAKQTNQGQKVVSPVLNRVAKWAMFVLNWVGVRRPRRHTSTQTSLECPPGISW